MKNSQSNAARRRMLNVGCGRQRHPDWCNIDLIATDDSVIAHDIRNGLPFEDNSFDVVYHSHVLEHLSPEEGELLVRECRRVLKTGGVLRMVVPDLERIAELYLQMLRNAWHGDKIARANYEWMKLELLDQLVRNQSGGLMGPYMIDNAKANREFVASRAGREIESCETTPVDRSLRRAGWTSRFREGMRRTKLAIMRKAIRLLLGTTYVDAFDEGVFRQQGEIHRWMYDRFSLRELCEKHGFSGFTICRADESQIKRFSDFQLDFDGARPRKPDSLFVECRKTAEVAVRAA